MPYKNYVFKYLIKKNSECLFFVIFTVYYKKYYQKRPHDKYKFKSFK